MMPASILCAKKCRTLSKRCAREKESEREWRDGAGTPEFTGIDENSRRPVAEFGGEIRAAWGLSGGVVWGKRKRRGRAIRGARWEGEGCGITPGIGGVAGCGRFGH